ncbi:class I SAM-dependent methyltransferase [Kribbella sp. NBC_01245]|uniref:class I SAM-dependent DNA methyltransferase n=1 Tax=Kribbella sp. NBC_01245 TaxID=2903578 RepID=UPI002E2CCD63|nr:class I SAM-dependent methyltransferase [Kribbella sp. NBC_01245]
MTEPAYLTTARSSYDTVAETYAELIPPLFAKDATGRGMLAAFAELVPTGLPVADVGCGPGHVTAHLNSLGLPVFGVDLSPKMVEIARQTYPGLRFEVGSMTALEVPDEALGGIVAWWSIFHLSPDVLPTLFAQFHRKLAPGGQLVIGFHVGDETIRPEQAYGHPVSYESNRLQPDHLTDLLTHAGLPVTARLIINGHKTPQAVLLAHKS